VARGRSLCICGDLEVTAFGCGKEPEQNLEQYLVLSLDSDVGVDESKLALHHVPKETLAVGVHEERNN
jgi:hypothetical protein